MSLATQWACRSSLPEAAWCGKNRYRAVFVENLDAYPGNSGSPVFNSTTHVVEGLQVRGKKNSFVKQGECFVSRVCPDTGCSGGLTVRTTEFARFIP
jgi:hypothetical protein